jgi:hypothetical protein
LLPASAERILERLGGDDLVLDVGGWAAPFARADWVIDLMPWQTRGLYGEAVPGTERFTEATWVEWDICERRAWPFEDHRFDFAICSHTLEDVRDPIWVCSELSRVARAGYVEVPSRLEEQCLGVHGPWVGWSHHHWLTDLVDGGLDFVFKPGVLHGRSDLHFPRGVARVLTPEERVLTLFWEGSLRATERIFFEPQELDAYLAEPVKQHLPALQARLHRDRQSRGLRARAAALRRTVRRASRS